MSTALRVENIHSYYGKSHIIQGVSLDLNEGEIVTLLGRNGAGKSSTLKSIAGLLTPRQGNVWISGLETTGWPAYRAAQHGLAKVPEDRLAQLLNGVDPRQLYWSDTLHAMREATPDCPITVWCNEDTPLVWPEILHEVTGLDPHVRLQGGLDVLHQIMAKEGMQRLKAYLDTHPIHNEIQRRRVLAAFLDKFALDDEVNEEITLPGWTEDLMEELSQTYDEDMREIKSISGVSLISV